MTAQTVFKRYELKFMLTTKQYELLKVALADHMAQDQFGRHTIHNVYFDTEDYLLIRRSLEKPCYKEKLRVRSYGKDSGQVFVELKKKFDGVVYKRRMELPKTIAFDFLTKGKPLAKPTQISREIRYFMEHYQGLKPMMYLDYEREAYYDRAGGELRLTFDHNIRQGNGLPVLSAGQVLLEVKTAMGLPSWLLEFFSGQKIYKTSFSKYGTAYEKYQLSKWMGGTTDVA